MKKIILLTLFVSISQFLSAQTGEIEVKNYTDSTAKYISNGIVQLDSSISNYKYKEMCFFRGILISNYDELSTAFITMTDINTQKKFTVYSNDYGEFVFRLMKGEYELKTVHPDYENLYIHKIQITGGEVRTLKLLIFDKPENRKQ